MCQNPEEVVSNACEGMDLLERGMADRQSESFLLPHSLYTLPPEDMAQIKGGSSHFSGGAHL